MQPKRVISYKMLAEIWGDILTSKTNVIECHIHQHPTGHTVYCFDVLCNSTITCFNTLDYSYYTNRNLRKLT